jgi:hypothetical protein
VTSTNCSLSEREEGISNNSSGCVAGVDGHEIEGEELGELRSERCLESMLERMTERVTKRVTVRNYLWPREVVMYPHILLLTPRGNVPYTRARESFEPRTLSWLQRPVTKTSPTTIVQLCCGA